MENDFEQKVRDAMREPRNRGELAAADAVGTVGNPECGEMLRMWFKFKEENGRRVIDQATFQSFGCETAIAVASLATEMLKGKTAGEALSLSGEALAANLGPLPPMKIHCGQLVEGAIRSALAPAAGPVAGAAGKVKTEEAAPGLMEKALSPQVKTGPVKVVFLDKAKPAPPS